MLSWRRANWRDIMRGIRPNEAESDEYERTVAGKSVHVDAETEQNS
jgi:hypothetical protein